MNHRYMYQWHESNLAGNGSSLARAAICMAFVFLLVQDSRAQDLEAQSPQEFMRVGHTCTGSGEFREAITWFKRAAEHPELRPEAYEVAHRDQEVLTRSNRTKRQFLDIFGQF